MGIAATQSNFLKLTQRNNDVKCRLMLLSADKMNLTREMDKVSRKYKDALNAKTLKLTDNGGITYSNITYGTMMSPCLENKNKPYIITDSSGRVVIDEKYKPYAEMISPDGSPADWEAQRSAVLSQLTGISATDIDNADIYYQTYLDSLAAYEDLLYSEPSRDSFTVQNSLATQQLLDKIGAYGGISDWNSAYGDSSQTVSQGEVPELMEHIKNSLSKYFLDDSEKFENACDIIGQTPIPGESIPIGDLIDMVIGSYAEQGGAFGPSQYADPITGNAHPLWYDVDTAAYNQYVTDHQEWETNLAQTKALMDSSLNAYNQIFTAENESLLNFYDDLFSTVAEKGWVYNPEVTNPDYLNQGLQNNILFITTVDRYKVETGNNQYAYENSYDTNIALNFDKVIQVNDADFRDQALVEYEEQKSKIKNKENVIDIQIQKCNTEQAAIQQMMEWMSKVIQNNIDNNLNIFS